MPHSVALHLGHPPTGGEGALPHYSKCTYIQHQCENKDESVILNYYLIFAILWNFSWATIQISHLAMIPEITSVEQNRMKLSTVRNAATVVSNLSTYAIFLLLIKTSNVKIS